MDSNRFRTCCDLLDLDTRALGAITRSDGRGLRRCKAGHAPVPRTLADWLERQVASVLRGVPRPALAEWMARTGDDPPPLDVFNVRPEAYVVWEPHELPTLTRWHMRVRREGQEAPAWTPWYVEKSPEYRDADGKVLHRVVAMGMSSRGHPRGFGTMRRLHDAQLLAVDLACVEAAPARERECKGRVFRVGERVQQLAHPRGEPPYPARAGLLVGLTASERCSVLWDGDEAPSEHRLDLGLVKERAAPPPSDDPPPDALRELLGPSAHADEGVGLDTQLPAVGGGGLDAERGRLRGTAQRL